MEETGETFVLLVRTTRSSPYVKRLTIQPAPPFVPDQAVGAHGSMMRHSEAGHLVLRVTS